MAQIVEKRFDPAAAAILITIEDELGARSVHTIHVLKPDGAEADVEAAIAVRLAEAADRAARVAAALRKRGWRG